MSRGGALFSNNASRGASKNLVEFKAGKMTMKDKMVNADGRKGQVYVYQSDDSLMHFCWKDRTTGVVEDDLIIFPDDCEYKHVAQCKTGRVYLLRFKSSSRKFFFWLQEFKTDKDEEYCKKINEVLNNPPTPGSQRSSGANHEGYLQNLLNNMSQQQLMQLFGGVGQIGGLGSVLTTMNGPYGTRGRFVDLPSTTASTPVTTSAARPPTAQTPAPTTIVDAPKPAGTPKPSTGRTAAPTNLLGIISTNNTIHLSDLQNLLSGIPASAGSDSVPPSGQAGPVIRQFGLGPDVINAATSGNLEDFVTALESEMKVGRVNADQQGPADAQEQQTEAEDEQSTKQTSSRDGPTGSKAKEKDDDGDDERMALD